MMLHYTVVSCLAPPVIIIILFFLFILDRRVYGGLRRRLRVYCWLRCKAKILDI